MNESEPPGPPRLPRVDPGTAERPVDAGSLSPELLAGLLADGDDELAAWTLSNALAELPRAVVFDGLLRDAMHLVGERWRDGQWGVAEEHMASQTLLRTLERVRPQLGPESRIGPLAVLAGVAGEQHMIGLVCLDQVLRSGGWTVANLGADVPVAEVGRFIGRNEARLLALTASSADRLPAVVASVAAARTVDRRPEPLPVLLGGRIADAVDLPADLDVDWIGNSLVGASHFAESILRSLSEPD